MSEWRAMQTDSAHTHCNNFVKTFSNVINSLAACITLLQGGFWIEIITTKVVVKTWLNYKMLLIVEYFPFFQALDLRSIDHLFVVVKRLKALDLQQSKVVVMYDLD